MRMRPDPYLHHVSIVLDTIQRQLLFRAAKILHEARTVFLAGNGGSSSTAGHFGQDLFKMSGVQTCVLTNDVPGMLAYGNDMGWVDMFANMLEQRGAGPGDVLVAISCSGRSPNIICAVRKANQLDVPVIVLTGRRRGNYLGRYANAVTIYVEHDDIRVQEDAHLAVCHSIVGLVAKRRQQKRE